MLHWNSRIRRLEGTTSSYRVPESDALLAADRLLEDKRFCEQLLFGLNAGVAEEDIRKVLRLGNRGQ